MNIYEVIAAWSDRPFSYGESDCCQFVGAVVEAVTGENPMKALSYKSKDEAMQIIREYGSLKDAVTTFLGDPIPIEKAQDGDVLMINMGDDKEMLATFVNGSCVYKTTTGVTDWPLSAATTAWSN